MAKYVLNIEPKPQSRPRFSSKSGAYEKSDMKQWKRMFGLLLMQQKAKIVEKGSIFVAMTFYIHPPQVISKIKTKRPRSNLELETMYVQKKPDIDNYIKAVLDASNGMLFKDDGQVAELSAKKMYSLQPRIEIEIKTLEEST